METVRLPGVIVVSREFDSRGREIPGRIIRKIYEEVDPTQHVGVFQAIQRIGREILEAREKAKEMES